MIKGHRIKTIYAKELVEILRDRRTLIAMIVVPVALYPLLIIGSVHLLSVQEAERDVAEINVAVLDQPDEYPRHYVTSVLREAKRLYESDESFSEEELDRVVKGIKKTAIVPVKDVEAAVKDGDCQVGVMIGFAEDATGSLPPEMRQVKIDLYYDQAEIRSEGALDRISRAFMTYADQWRNENIAKYRIVPSVVDPLVTEAHNVAAPEKVGGMLLGNIIPLVLVLMTITGAIYPAIDLTAGERERGTLETLVVCPVPPIVLITGKYLVVTTIALLGATLNLVCVAVTLYFSGVSQLLEQGGQTELPLGVLPLILLGLVPFALLFSAVMVAVCSYARTFKEAQNYIMPVILAALIPGGIATLPGTELTTVNSVIPVMNMVLLARELLIGHWQWASIALVLLSTTFYAIVAVCVASRIFSMETVVFADSASLRSLFTRRMFKPSRQPAVAMALVLVALLFPLWFFLQSWSQMKTGGNISEHFKNTALWMPFCFVGLPLAVLLYWKVDVANTLRLGLPKAKYWLVAILAGVAAWVPAHELFAFQVSIFGKSPHLAEMESVMREGLATFPTILLPVVMIAVVPGFCEELLFRGFLLSGLRQSIGKWKAILAVACVFAVFHVMLSKFVITAGLGMMMGYICWQSRSIWPGILAHVLHNSSAVLFVTYPQIGKTLRIDEADPTGHLPAHIIAGGLVLVAIAMLLCREPAEHSSITPQSSDQLT